MRLSAESLTFKWGEVPTLWQHHHRGHSLLTEFLLIISWSGWYFVPFSASNTSSLCISWPLASSPLTRPATVLPHSDLWARPQKHLSQLSVRTTNTVVPKQKRLYCQMFLWWLPGNPNDVCCYVHLRNGDVPELIYTNWCLLHSFVMTGHLWLGTPRVYECWIKTHKIVCRLKHFACWSPLCGQRHGSSDQFKQTFFRRLDAHATFLLEIKCLNLSNLNTRVDPVSTPSSWTDSGLKRR